MGNITKLQVVSSFFWKLLERLGTQGIHLLVQIVLARLLLPEQFGTIAIVMIFIAFSNVFVQAGFNTALIQKKHADETDFSSVFYFNLLIASILYVLLYTFAPVLSNFYSIAELTNILRIMSLSIFFGAVNSIQFAYISRNMQFKKYFISSLFGIVVSAVVGISMAYLGYGVWALVAVQILNSFLKMLVLGFIISWKPKLLFSFTRVKELFSFGWKLLVSNLLDTAYLSMYSLVIGKIYTAEVLGYFNKAELFPKAIATNIKGSISNVIFPVLSSYQDDKIAIKKIVRRAVKLSTFLMFPLMVGLMVCAQEVVSIILTDKWLPSVPFIQLLCLSFALYPIHTANLQAINALGRSDIFLRLEIIKKIIGVSALIFSIPFGIYVMVALIPVTSIIATFLNAYPNRRLIGYSYFEQWKDIFPALLITSVMGISIKFIDYFSFENWTSLTIKVILGLIIYTLLSYIFKLDSLNYILKSFKEIYRKKRSTSTFNSGKT